MKRRVATVAILALLGAATPALAGGWYLMIPKWYPATGKLAFDLPLSEWVQLEAFSSVEECERTRRKTIDDANKERDDVIRQYAEKSFSPETFREDFRNAVCVSSDDQRLAR
jgi:hypothetical protein